MSRMMLAEPRYVCILLAAMCAAMIAGAAQPKPPDARLGAALAAWEQSAAALQSYDLVLRMEATDMTAHPKVDLREAKSHEELRAEPILLPAGIEPTVITESVRQVVSAQGKRRYDDLDPNGGGLTHAKVFDGEIVRWFSRKQGTGGVSAAGPDQRGFAPYYKDYGALYRDLPMGGAIIPLLRSRQGTRIVEGQGAERNYVVIESPPEGKDNYPKLELRIALDPNHGMMPAEIDSRFRSSKQSPLWRITIERFDEVEPGVWAPVRATYRWGPPGKVFSIIKLVVDMGQSRWNKPVSEDLFTLAFPVGTTVKDDVRSLVYATGKPDTGKNVDELLDGARQVIRLPVAAPPKVKVNAQGLTRIILVAANVALIAVLVAIFSFRRWRRLRKA